MYREWKKREFPQKSITYTHTHTHIYIYIYIHTYINLETTRLKSRPRNGWQDEVREDGRLVGRKGFERNGI